MSREISLDTFKGVCLEMINIINLDLDTLEAIAENSVSKSSSTTTETTRRPDEVTISKYDMQVSVSRCTIPMAMTCFAVIDMFGYWISDKKESDFSKTANSFFHKLSNDDSLKTVTSQQKIKEFYRNAIMHSFFPKNGFAISYTSFEGNSLFVNIDAENTILDVKHLLKLVRNGLTHVSNEINKNESELINELYQGYLKWLEK